MDNNVIKNLLSSISSSSYYPIKRSFGQTINNCSIDTIIAFSKIANKNNNDIEQNAEFLIAGLCYNTLKPESKINETKVNFETLLKRLAATDKDKSKPRTSEIENFLKLKFDTTGYFNKRFVSLAKKTIPMINQNEIINYEQLLHDFKNWDKNNTVKIRWAITIANIEMEEN